jgi:hypothetical protein
LSRRRPAERLHHVHLLGLAYISQLEGHPKAAPRPYSCAPLIVSDARGVPLSTTASPASHQPRARALHTRDLLADQGARVLRHPRPADLTNFGIAPVLEEEVAARKASRPQARLIKLTA